MKNAPKMYKFLYPAFSFFTKLIRQPVIEGLENVPAEGPVVIAGNHMNFNDGFILVASNKRCVHFLCKDEMFKNKILAAFLHSVGVIPVNRREKDRHALPAAKAVLNEGGVVGIFPEGTTNKTGGKVLLLPFKIGAIKMAYDTGAPIVPFTLTGHYSFFRKTLKLKFYEPFKVESDDLTKENEKFSELIKEYLLNEKR